MKLTAEKNELIEEACRQSEALLVANSTRHGILASRENPERNYHAVWGRDGSICACGAFLSDDEAVREAGVTTLRTLAAHQGENGQMPSYLHVDEQGEITDVVYGGAGQCHEHRFEPLVFDRGTRGVFSGRLHGIPGGGSVRDLPPHIAASGIA
jgi:hypothetical protein